MSLRIPTDKQMLIDWSRETVDECMASADDRGLIYTRATQYYYQGSFDTRAAIFNKIRPFVDRLAGFLMQPTDVRFQVLYDSGEPADVLDRAQLVGEKLSADFKQTNSDVQFAEAVVWALINGCQILKIAPDSPHGQSFRITPIHPQNFGVLSETVLDLEEQECVCHVSFPTVSRLRAMLEEINHPDRREIIATLMEARESERDEETPSYFHQMIIGGLNPVGTGDASNAPQAAGIVNVFPVPTPWRARRRISRTVRFCELWVRDRDSKDPYSVIQMVYPDILIEGQNTRRNIGKIPGRLPFTKIQGQVTPGYFWGRSVISDVQMLQDVLNKRLRDIAVMWDRNAAAPQVFSGFTSVTEETYWKIISEGGFIADPNPNAKAQKLVEPPPQGYLEELEFLWKLFDEASGFTPIMGGQGEPGVRAGVHAQTLVRTSSPRLIDQAARIERQLADTGYRAFRIMQAMDPSVYRTDNGVEFRLLQLPEDFQVQVDSHSASPAFAEDNRQLAIALARAGAIDSEDLIHLLHPPGAELLLTRLRQRQKAQAQAAQQQHQEELLRDVIGLPQHGRQQHGGGGSRHR
jgi:hypothetical protein